MASNSFLKFQGPKRPNIKPGTQQLLGDPTGNLPTFEELQGQTGKAGKVESPLTGKNVKPPRAYADTLAVQGPREAMDFRFQNLPDARTTEAVSGLLGAGQQAGRDRQTALREVQELQQRALAPNLDAETRRFFQNMADERRAEVESEFAQGGGIANQFERLGASNIAQLANRGVLDATTGAQTIARQNVDLAALRNQLLNQAAEQSRQELLGEREGIRGTATQFGGLQGQLATAAGQLQQSGLQGAGQLGLQARDQAAQEQLAEVGQRLLGSQTALQNIQSLRNQRFNRQQAREQAALQQKLIDQMGSQLGGGLGSLIGGGLGLATAAIPGVGPFMPLIAGAIGSQAGGQIGRSF